MLSLGNRDLVQTLDHYAVRKRFLSVGFTRCRPKSVRSGHGLEVSFTCFLGLGHLAHERGVMGGSWTNVPYLRPWFDHSIPETLTRGLVTCVGGNDVVTELLTGARGRGGPYFRKSAFCVI